MWTAAGMLINTLTYNYKIGIIVLFGAMTIIIHNNIEGNNKIS